MMNAHPRTGSRWLAENLLAGNRLIVGVARVLVAAFLAQHFLVGAAARVSAQPPATAIVGATVIDGNGGPPIPDATILVQGRRISAIGPRTSVEVPAGAHVIDGAGKYVTPGFIDTNVHLNLSFSWDETNARYWHRNAEITLQAAQLHLKHGVTTVRDSYGALLPGIEVRDAIARGEVPGPRMYVAGNIVGWGGPYSETFSGMPESELTLFQEQINDSITLGTGEELMHMTPEELRDAINAYLDLGPDFIKYGGTSHMSYPAGIMFSPRAQRVIVEETHKRGLVAETHSATLEGLRLSVLAGIDLIQHPRSLGRREITDELLDLIVERGVICSGLQNTITGEAWQWHLEERERAERAQAAAAAQGRRAPLTTAEIRRNRDAADMARAIKRSNAEKLIGAGCITSVGTDNLAFGHRSAAPEFQREQHVLWEHQAPGRGTIMAIEGLVELGMTPSEAIVAATRNGALACRALDDFGTLEVGKLADLLVLGADPLADISNVRELEVVMKEGQVIDTGELPTDPVVDPWAAPAPAPMESPSPEAARPTVQLAPYAMSWEEPMSVRAEGYDYDHEVLVALPPSYHVSPERRYPVLWSMDGAMAFSMTAGIVNFYALGSRIPEIIVVGVGHPSEEGMAGLGKRTFDLFPPGSVVADEGVAADYMKEELGLDFATMEPLLKGDRFLAFLVDQLRPLLGQQYRMADDHTLWGHSAGGAFAGYALLVRPGAFDRFIIGSGTNGLTIELEAAYARDHDDLAARVFIGMADGEINNPGLSAQRLASRTSLLAENLRLRQYPSLDLRTRLYTDRDHLTVMPLIIADGLQHVYEDLIADLPQLPW